MADLKNDGTLLTLGAVALLAALTEVVSRSTKKQAPFDSFDLPPSTDWCPVCDGQGYRTSWIGSKTGCSECDGSGVIQTGEDLPQYGQLNKTVAELDEHSPSDGPPVFHPNPWNDRERVYRQAEILDSEAHAADYRGEHKSAEGLRLRAHNLIVSLKKNQY